MKTFCLELRHAPSKRKLNALPDNRLDPLKSRMASDQAAIDWAQTELLEFARRRSGENYQYVEAALLELLPFGQLLDGKDYRRLGRWVCNTQGINWRDAMAVATDEEGSKCGVVGPAGLEPATRPL